MKNYIKYFYAVLFLISVVACEDEDKDPFPSSNYEEDGGVLRTITGKANEVDIADIENSIITIEVEAEAFTDQDLIESMDVYVEFRDTFVDEDQETPDTIDDEDISKAEVLLTTIDISEFTEGPNQLPRYELNIPAPDAIDALNLNDDLESVDGGDIFRVRLALNLSNGETYSVDNVTNNVTGIFFDSPFSYDANVICGYSENFLVGSYQMDWISGVFPAFGVTQTFASREVEIIANSGTSRTIVETTYLVPFDFTGPLDFDLICGKIIVPIQELGGGVTCDQITTLSGGTVSQLNSGTFDITGTDDSSFSMIIIDAVDPAGCGVGPYEVVLQFTKL
ncbi:hypothetical protein [Gangjinia marincola]